MKQPSFNLRECSLFSIMIEEMIISCFQRQNIQQGKLLRTLEDIKLNYDTLSPEICPEIFYNRSFSLSFDANKDMKLENNEAAYFVYQYFSKTNGVSTN